MLSAIICCLSLVFSDIPQCMSQNRMRILQRALSLRRSLHVTKAEAVERATILNSERKNPAAQVEKNPAWKAPNNFSHKSSAFFLFTGNSKLFDLKMVHTVTIWKLLWKVFESDNVEEGEQVWEASFIPRKKAIWKRVPEYFWKEGGLLLQPGCISLDWREKEMKKYLGFAHIM